MYLLYVIMQIILESLPISSSGHLQLLGLQVPEYIERLTLGPTIMMLMLYFYKEIFAVLCDIKKQWRWVCAWGFLIVMATCLTVIVYELIGPFVVNLPLWFGFGLTSFMLLSLYRCPYKNTLTEPRFMPLMILGLAQGCARLPGVSRLGTTYTVACWLGFSPHAAFRISCALQMPLFAAGFLEGVWKLWRMGGLGLEYSLPTVLIYSLFILVTTACAYIVLWGVEALMVRRKLWCIGFYMLILAFIAFLFA